MSADAQSMEAAGPYTMARSHNEPTPSDARETAVALLMRDVRTGTGLDSILRRAIDLIADTLSLSLVGVWQRSERDQHYVMRVGRGFRPGDVGRLTLNRGPRTLADHTLQSRTVVTVDGDAGSTTADVPEMLAERGALSGVCVPIGAGSNGFGVLTAFSPRPEPCSSADIRFLSVIGNLLTVATERSTDQARIAREQQRVDDLGRRIRDFTRRHEHAIRLAGIIEWEWTDPQPPVPPRQDADAPKLPPELCFDAGPQALVDHAHPHDAAAVAQAVNWALANGQPMRFGVRLETDRGTRHFDVQSYGPGREGHRGDSVAGVARDVTAERQVTRKSKPPTVGGKTKGEAAAKPPTGGGETKGANRSALAAHDLNNLLTVVLNSAELMSDQDAGRRELRAILAAARRAQGLVDELLGSPRSVERPAATNDLRRALLAVRELLPGLVGPRIRIRVDLDDEPCPVLLSRKELDQVVLNLVTNSRDALAHDGQLRLTVDRTLRLNPLHVGPVIVPPGRWARLTVADNGIGIVPEDLEHVFEAFFTTKNPGGGAGLGLAAVRHTVAAAGGHVTVESAPQRGTSVRVYLPLATSAEPGSAAARHSRASAEPGSAAARHSRASAEPGSAAARQPETIAKPGAVVARRRTQRLALVAEDQRDVRELATRTLQRLGFSVVAAVDGAQALRRGTTASHVDILVSDLVMPRVGGLELAERLRALHPRLRVLLLSGYAPPARLLDEQVKLLRKPFGLRDLQAAIKSLVSTPTRV